MLSDLLALYLSLTCPSICLARISPWFLRAVSTRRWTKQTRLHGRTWTLNIRVSRWRGVIKARLYQRGESVFNWGHLKFKARFLMSKSRKLYKHCGSGSNVSFSIRSIRVFSLSLANFLHSLSRCERLVYRVHSGSFWSALLSKFCLSLALSVLIGNKTSIDHSERYISINPI